MAWDAPQEHKQALLRQLRDGAQTYDTASRRLADRVLRLLGDLGVVAALQVEGDRYRITLAGDDDQTGHRRFGDGTAWLQVAGLRREPFDGLVYSLEVPDAHTVVTTGGLVTHNCFPKDVEAFIHIAGELGYDFGMLRETDRVNREAKTWPLAQLRRLLWNVAGKEIAVLGLAFKPGTDDLRDAPALEVVDGLLAEGARVRLHDPAALPHVRGRYPDAVLCDKAEDALRDAHAVVVCTEWDEYAAIAPERLKDLLQYPVVVDARNIWDPAALEAVGLNVASVGRPLTDT